MRILLPPSEGKAPRGRARSLADRGFEGPLAQARLAVLEAVSAWCASDPEEAATGLGLPASSVLEDLQANVGVLRGKTMPALDRFQGVVFDGLAAATLTAAERRIANRTVLISSGGFGLVGAGEPLPDHRIPMAATVPGVGGLTPYWRRHLADVVPAMVAARHLVVDLRSTDYLAAPPVPAECRRRVLSVRVLTERPLDGGLTRGVVSYSSKLTKGQLARALLTAAAGGADVRKPADVAEIAAAAGFRVETATSDNGQPSLDLVLAG